MQLTSPLLSVLLCVYGRKTFQAPCVKCVTCCGFMGEVTVFIVFPGFRSTFLTSVCVIYVKSVVVNSDVVCFLPLYNSN